MDNLPLDKKELLHKEIGVFVGIAISFLAIYLYAKYRASKAIPIANNNDSDVVTRKKLMDALHKYAVGNSIEDTKVSDNELEDADINEALLSWSAAGHLTTPELQGLLNSYTVRPDLCLMNCLMTKYRLDVERTCP